MIPTRRKDRNRHTHPAQLHRVGPEHHALVRPPQMGPMRLAPNSPDPLDTRSPLLVMFPAAWLCFAVYSPGSAILHRPRDAVTIRARATFLLSYGVCLSQRSDDIVLTRESADDDRAHLAAPGRSTSPTHTVLAPARRPRAAPARSSHSGR